MHPRNILADINDTSANLGNFANMSLDFGNMSLDDQAPIVNDRSRSPNHSEEAEDPQPSLTGWIPERERLRASPDPL